MKLANRIFILTLISLIGFGCNKKLDVEPRQNITPEQIRTGDDVKAVLFGAYTLLQDPDAFGERFFITSDLLANTNHTLFVGTFLDYKDLAGKTTINTNALAQGIWSNSYTIINVTNTVLEKIDLVSEDERDEVAAEAKFIRGLVYFELINYFGLPYSASTGPASLGVPIVDYPVYDYQPARDNPARNSVAEVYTFLLKDLTEAAAGLPATSTAARADKWAAHAILSRVYLNMANYQAAAAAANAVIASDNFELAGNFAAAFNNAANSSEDVFAIQQSSQSNSGTTNNGINTFYAANDLPPPFITGRGDLQANENYYGIFEPQDQRGDFWYTGVSIAGSPGVYTAKWQQFYKAIPVIRLAEMYLTRGEANYRLGTAVGATPLSDINEVRARSGASLLNVIPSVNTFIDERFRELAFEGDRLWTLKRTKSTAGGLAYDNGKLVLPIPQREMDINKSLIQNPGYAP
jgi:starch-binding outer membrane protein, SusD/RagB family